MQVVIGNAGDMAASTEKYFSHMANIFVTRNVSILLLLIVVVNDFFNKKQISELLIY